MVSQDGLHVLRPPPYKPGLGIYQANFGWRIKGQVTSRIMGNGHLDITDMVP